MRLLAAALALALAGAPAPVREAAQLQLARGAASSLQVAIVDRGVVAASQSFGGATPDTEFAIGSVTKMFTAVSIMQLVERKALRLDDSAAKYLPQYPVLKTISIRELLAHTSGLPNYLDQAVASGAIDKPTTPGAILAQALAGPLDFSPGTDWNYSNTGYVVLGQIVERVSGLTLAAYEQRFLFAPARLRHTFVAPTYSWYYACGDLFSNAADLARFDIALMNGRLVRPRTFAQMQQTVPFLTLAPQIRDGLGLFSTQNGALVEIGHHGGVPGYRADDEMIPGKQFAVVVLGSGNYDTRPVVDAALNAYFPSAHVGSAPPEQAYVDGAPRITSRMSAVLAGLRDGTVDRKQFNVLASLTIPPATNLLKSYGALTQLRFLSKTYTGSDVLYQYDARFTGGRLAMRVELARDGKIDAFQLLRETPK